MKKICVIRRSQEWCDHYRLKPKHHIQKANDLWNSVFSTPYVKFREWLHSIQKDNLEQIPFDDICNIDQCHDYLESNEHLNADFRYYTMPEYDLPNCLPNPFVLDLWPEMKIPFKIESSDWITLTIFSSQGYHVYQTEDYFERDEVNTFRWNGKVKGEQVPSGVYLYVITGNSKMIKQGKFAVIQ